MKDRQSFVIFSESSPCFPHRGVQRDVPSEGRRLTGWNGCAACMRLFSSKRNVTPSWPLMWWNFYRLCVHRCTLMPRQSSRVPKPWQHVKTCAAHNIYAQQSFEPSRTFLVSISSFHQTASFLVRWQKEKKNLVWLNACRITFARLFIPLTWFEQQTQGWARFSFVIISVMCLSRAHAGAACPPCARQQIFRVTARNGVISHSTSCQSVAWS